MRTVADALLVLSVSHSTNYNFLLRFQRHPLRLGSDCFRHSAQAWAPSPAPFETGCRMHWAAALQGPSRQPSRRRLPSRHQMQRSQRTQQGSRSLTGPRESEGAWERPDLLLPDLLGSKGRQPGSKFVHHIIAAVGNVYGAPVACGAANSAGSAAVCTSRAALDIYAAEVVSCHAGLLHMGYPHTRCEASVSISVCEQ